MKPLKNCPFCGSNDLILAEESDTVNCGKCCICIYRSIWNNRHSPWISLIEKFIKEVENHRDNGHKALSINWILNQFKSKKETE